MKVSKNRTISGTGGGLTNLFMIPWALQRQFLNRNRVPNCEMWIILPNFHFCGFYAMVTFDRIIILEHRIIV